MKTQRRPIPWLVKFRDLQRYLYRAVRACARGHVIFFYYRIKRGEAEQLFTLSPYPDHRGVLADARESFGAGRVNKIRLEDLPAIR